GIPSSSFVSLKVFDAMGREVATLVNEELAPGTYERTFDAKGLASGVYFYQLRAGLNTITRVFIHQ
ncbi:MAG: T9SS type A sorting domain-containing protein, partial [Candidatus Kapaibacteriales bacterium]